MIRFSKTLRSGKILLPSGTWEMPRSTIWKGSNAEIFFPSNSILPLAGCTKPDMVSSKVDFPDPLAPIIATISPGLTDNDTSHRAWKLPCNASIWLILSNVSSGIPQLSIMADTTPSNPALGRKNHQPLPSPAPSAESQVSVEFPLPLTPPPPHQATVRSDERLRLSLTQASSM